jgi:hypothetical protein
MFRFSGRQRSVARSLVRGNAGWKQWMANNNKLSRELTTPELNRAINDLNLRLDLLVALRAAKLLPIWDRSLQLWIPNVRNTTPRVKPMPATTPATNPDYNAMLDLIADQAREIAALKREMRETRIAAGLEFADPEELSDVGMQKDFVRQEYDAFHEHNPLP